MHPSPLKCILWSIASSYLWARTLHMIAWGLGSSYVRILLVTPDYSMQLNNRHMHGHPTCACACGVWSMQTFQFRFGPPLDNKIWSQTQRIWQMSWETIQMLCGINFSTVIYFLIMKPYQGKRTKLVQVMYMDVVMMYTCTYLLLHVCALVIPPYGAYMHVAHSLTEIWCSIVHFSYTCIMILCSESTIWGSSSITFSVNRVYR